MAKTPDLTDVGNVLTSASTINSNYDEITSAFENTLSLDGSSPNAMEADLDLNGNDILNVGEISADSIAIAGTSLAGSVEEAAASAAAALASEEAASTSADEAASSAADALTSENNASDSADAAAASATSAAEVVGSDSLPIGDLRTDPSLNSFFVSTSGRIDDGDLDYGITIKSTQPGLAFVDRSSGAGQSLISGDGSGLIFYHDSVNNDGTIGGPTNADTQPSVSFQSDQQRFFVDGSEAVKFDSTGISIFGDALSDSLPEEGTWTPALEGSAGYTGVTYASVTGTYHKIARRVTIWFYIGISNKNAAGTENLRITGLPFVPALDNPRYMPGSFVFQGITSSTSLQLVLEQNGGAVSTYVVSGSDLGEQVSFDALDTFGPVLCGTLSYLTDD